MKMDYWQQKWLKDLDIRSQGQTVKNSFVGIENKVFFNSGNKESFFMFCCQESFREKNICTFNHI